MRGNCRFSQICGIFAKLLGSTGIDGTDEDM
jgi:hypothetical protein